MKPNQETILTLTVFLLVLSIASLCMSAQSTSSRAPYFAAADCIPTSYQITPPYYSHWYNPWGYKELISGYTSDVLASWGNGRMWFWCTSWAGPGAGTAWAGADASVTALWTPLRTSQYSVTFYFYYSGIYAYAVGSPVPLGFAKITLDLYLTADIYGPSGLVFSDTKGIPPFPKTVELTIDIGEVSIYGSSQIICSSVTLEAGKQYSLAGDVHAYAYSKAAGIGNSGCKLDFSGGSKYIELQKIVIVDLTPDTTPPPPPNISSTTHPDENKWYSNNDPTFQWTTPYDPSGIDGYSYTLDHSSSTTPDQTILTTGNSKSYTDVADGTWYFHVRAKDKACNWGSADHYGVKIDTTGPSCSGVDDGVSGWSSDNTPTFSWSCSDFGSGVAGCYWWVDGGGESWTTSTSVTLPVQSDGSHTFYCRCKDNAGNIGNTCSHSFQIDTMPPSTPSPDDGVSGWSSDNTPTFSWSSSSDSGSGVKGYWWKVDGGGESWTTSTSVTLPVQSDGSHTFYVRAEDNAGNKGSYGQHSFQIDTMPPSTPSPDDGVTGPNSDNTPTFTWPASSDSLSGVKGYWWKVDGGGESWTTSTSVTLPVQSDGSHTFYVRAEDNAGNKGSYGQHDFQIQTPGSINGRVTDASNGNGIPGATVAYSGPASGSVLTDANGYYNIPNLPPGSYSLTASKSGYTSQTKSATVNSGAATVVDFQLQPIQTYQVTIAAECSVCGPVGVPISPSGILTPHTFTGLSGVNTFDLPSTDANGHTFKQWSTGSTSLTITVTSGGTYIGYYGVIDSLTVTSPNGGESWVRGTTHPITWTSTGSVGASVRIELLKSGVVKGSLTTANDGSYSWTIGSSHLGSDYRIRIASTSNPAITDTSDNYFSITADGGPGTLTVTSPNGGESWVRGTTHMITWTSTGSVGASVRIELLKSGVVKGSLTTANDGSYSWTIGSSHLGSDYRIRIASTSNPAITDTSDNNFAITT